MTCRHHVSEPCGVCQLERAEAREIYSKIINRLRGVECSRELDRDIHDALGRIGHPAWKYQGRDIIPRYSEPHGRRSKMPSPAEQFIRMIEYIKRGEIPGHIAESKYDTYQQGLRP